MKSIKIIALLLLIVAFRQTMTAQAVGTPYVMGAISKPIVITALNCGSAVKTGTLTSGTTASGVTVSVPYTGGNGGSYGAFSIASTVVTGLTATASAGNVANGNGSIIFTITGTPSTYGNATFSLTLGTFTCSFTASVANIPGVITGTTPSGTINGFHNQGQSNQAYPYDGSLGQFGTLCDGTNTGYIQFRYTGGNGGSYPAYDFWIGGAHVHINAGNFNVGNGAVNVYVIGGSANTCNCTEVFNVSFYGTSYPVSVKNQNVAATGGNCG